MPWTQNAMKAPDDQHPYEDGYPPPEQNPHCRCWPDMTAAFFCATGHMTECHYPMSCREAKCSHLPRYDAEAYAAQPDPEE